MEGYCPHFQEVMELDNCYFCNFKKEKEASKNGKIG